MVYTLQHFNNITATFNIAVCFLFPVYISSRYLLFPVGICRCILQRGEGCKSQGSLALCRRGSPRTAQDNGHRSDMGRWHTHSYPHHSATLQNLVQRAFRKGDGILSLISVSYFIIKDCCDIGLTKGIKKSTKCIGAILMDVESSLL